MKWQHVYPRNDSKEHWLECENMAFDSERGEPHPSCPCNPEIDWFNYIVIHNAWDMREVQEYLKDK